ncbi:hypothetical protein RclHR1_31590001 [Rhizophagus clarus]|uniref:Protein kinase domain-containing protein n=1 Tax=Rhizophagus clarus TaxID=94130 RepID=A0A2Z6R7U8_9GLOM|nr:hypothetical protein RclHR1_31590001 [Rhizophagus clarus]
MDLRLHFIDKPKIDNKSSILEAKIFAYANNTNSNIMQILKRIFKKKKSLWKDVNYEKYQGHVFISSNDSTTKSEEIDNNRIVYIEDIEKRKEIYGICGECNEPGTGEYWCQPCNAKRFKKNFKNWTSGNKDIDDLIQHSQINAVHYKNCFEWIPYENFQNVNYITKGSFAKIYLADWPEGYIWYWDIENKKWHRYKNYKVALKSLDNFSETSARFFK